MKFLGILFAFSLILSGTSPCVEKLDNGFLFVKAYPVSPNSNGYFETSYVCTRGTIYGLKTCPGSKITKLEIYNSNRNKVVEIGDPSALPSSIQYPCSATGIYYFRLYGGGGELVLGFKRA